MRFLNTFIGRTTLSLFFFSALHAQTFSSEVTRADTWLRAQVQTNGSIAGADNAIANPTQVGGEVARALGATGLIPAALLQQLNANPERSTEYLARRALARSATQPGPGELLGALKLRQNSDGGFAPENGYASSLVDSAFALTAFSELSDPPGLESNRGCSFLAAKQNADGSFGGATDNRRAVLTGMILEALFKFVGAHPNNAAIAKGMQWLKAQLESSSDLLALAHGVIAMRIASPDQSLASSAVLKLKSAQLANGSFSNDPYLTAVVIRALLVSNSVPPPPTTGALAMRVVSFGSTAPIGDVSVVLSGVASASTLTGANGNATFLALAPGEYGVLISKSGYRSSSVQVIVNAGQRTDLGDVALQLMPVGSGLRGVIRDSTSLAPLANASVVLSGAINATAQSDQNGRYELLGLSTGPTTVAISKSGYQAISQQITFTQNTIFDFSPPMFAAGTPPTSAIFVARVIDQSTAQPLPGASMQLGTASAQSGTDGTVRLTDLPPGFAQGTIAAAGYASRQFSLVLSAGTNAVGDIALVPTSSPTSLTLRGRVLAANSLMPIAGASIVIQGMGLSAQTGADGRFEIAAITQLSVSVSISAAGFLSQTVGINAAQFGVSTLEIALAPIAGVLAFESVVSDQPSYAALTEVIIGSELRNEGSTGQQVRLSLVITDAQNQLIGQVAYITPDAALLSVITVAPNARYPMQMEWYTNASVPGTYRATLQAFAATGGALLAERSTTFVINPTLRVGGLINLDPPIAVLDNPEPIAISAKVINQGNLTLPGGSYDLKIRMEVPDSAPPAIAAPQQSIVNGGQLFDAIPANLPRQPFVTVIDAAGNVYAYANRTIYRLQLSGTLTAIHTINTTGSTLPCRNAGITDMDVATDGGFVMLLQGSCLVRTSAAGVDQIFPTVGSAEEVTIDASGVIYLGFTDHISRFNTNGTETTIAKQGLVRPQDIVIRADGELLVSDETLNSVQRVAGGVVSNFVTGIAGARGMALASDGTLYVVSGVDKKVIKILVNGTKSDFVSGFVDPFDITLAADGSFFVSDQGGRAIIKVLATGVKSVFAIGLADTANGLKYDVQNRLHVLNDLDQMALLTPAGERSYLGASRGARDLEILANGGVYMSHESRGILKLDASNSFVPFFSGAGIRPQGLARDAQDNLYFYDATKNIINRLSPAGVASVFYESVLALPETLTFNQNNELLIVNRDFLSIVRADGGTQRLTSSLVQGKSAFALSDGTILIGERSGIRKLKLDGTLETVASTPTSVTGLVQTPAGILYTLGTNASLQRINPDGSNSVVFTLSQSQFIGLVGTPSAQFGLDASGKIWRFTAAQPTPVAPFATPGMFAQSITLGANGKLYVTTNTKLYQIDPVTAAVAIARTVSSAKAGTMLSDGRIAIMPIAAAELNYFNDLGQASGDLQGFDYLYDLEIVGSTMYFVHNQQRLLAMSLDAPLAARKISDLASTRRHFLAQRNGNLLISDGPILKELSGNALSALLTVPIASDISGIASAGNGELAVVTSSDQLFLYSNPTTLRKSFAALDQPKGMALDATGNLLVADYTQGKVFRFSSDGNQISTVASLSSPQWIASLSNNETIVTGISSIRYDAGWNNLGVLTTPASPLYGVVANGTEAYLTTRDNAQVLRWTNQGISIIASGISGFADLLAAGDSVWFLDFENSSISKVTAAGLEFYSSAINRGRHLLRLQNGDFGVVTENFRWYSHRNGVFSAPWDLAPYFNGYNARSFAGVDTKKVLYTQAGSPGIFQITIPDPAPPIPAGAIVYQSQHTVPTLNPASSAFDIALGNFRPTQGGDYRVELKPSAAAVTGSLISSLHVGGHADAAISLDYSRVGAPNARVVAQLDIAGLDDASLARPIPAAVTVLPVGANDYIKAFGIDPQGRVLVSNRVDQLQRYTFNGGSLPTVELIATLPMAIHGAIPIDDNGDAYVGSGNFVKKVTANGQISDVANLQGLVQSIARISNGDLIVLAGESNVWRVKSNGSMKSVLATVVNSFSLTANARDEIFIQTIGSHVLKLSLTGAVTKLFDDTNFENEGANIAGDCANNLFVVPTFWPRVNPTLFAGEENIVAQWNGTSKTVGVILNSRTINNDFSDIDTVIFDARTSTLVFWNHFPGHAIIRVPVICGAVKTEAHIVVPRALTVDSFDPLPSSQLILPNGDKELIWRFAEVGSLGARIRLAANLTNLRLGERRKVFKDAYLLFKNSFQPLADVQLPITIPEVTVDNIVAGTLSLDAVSYPQASAVGVNLALTNQGISAVSGELVVEVFDAQDQLVRELLRELVTIDAAANFGRQPPFNTANTLAGAYSVRARLFSAQQIELARWQQPFTITPGTAPGVQARTTVSTDQAEYGPGTQVVLNLTTSNLASNQILDGLTSITEVKRPDGSVLQSFARAAFSLNPSAQLSYSFEFNIGSAPAGIYRVDQTLKSSAGTVIASATVNFNVRASGISLAGLQGSLLAMPTTIEAGATARFTVNLRNLGNAALQDVPITLAIVDIAAQHVLAQWRAPRNIALDAIGTTFTQDWESLGSAPGSYVAVLRAGVVGAERDLAQVNLSVTAPQISFVSTQVIERDSRLLVLITCKADVNETACTNSRKIFMGSYLTTLGVQHSVVSSAESFASEFRSGRYNVYWLAGGARKLRGNLFTPVGTTFGSRFEGDEDRTSLLGEMAQRLYRGDSMWLDGSYEALNYDALTIAGVSFDRSIGSANSVLLPGGVYIAGTFGTTGNNDRYLSNPGSGSLVLASFNDALNTPAIFTRALGQGKALLMGFDYLAALQAQSGAGLVPAQVFERTSAHLLPGIAADYVPGDQVPITTTITNQFGAAIIAEIKSTLPTGARALRILPNIATLSGTPETNQIVTWRVPMASLAQRRFEVVLQLPSELPNAAASADVALLTRVASVRADGLVVPFSEVSFPLSLTGGAAAASSLRQRMLAYPVVSPVELEARAIASGSVAEAAAQMAAGEYLSALQYWLDAARALARITSFNIDSDQRVNAGLLAQTQRLWASQLPNCLQASAPAAPVRADNFRAIAPLHGAEMRGGSATVGEFEVAIGPNVRSVSASSGGDFSWVNGKSYGYDINMLSDGSGSLRLLDGAATVLTQNYVPTANQRLNLSNAVQFALHSDDDSSATLHATVTSVNTSPVLASLINPAGANYYSATRSYYHENLSAGLNVRGTLTFAFAGARPPGSYRMSFKILPGRAACMAPFAVGAN